MTDITTNDGHTPAGAIEDEKPWREMGIDLTDIRSWIASALPNRVLSERAPQVLNRKDWSLVARFDAQESSGEADIVYKATLLPEFVYGASVFALLSRHCAGFVPHLLACREVPGRSDMLFSPFTGVSVQETGNFDALMGMARTIARIQHHMARVPISERDGIPILRPREIPALLDDILKQMADVYEPLWNADENAMRIELGIPVDLSSQLAAFRPHVHAWAETLEAHGPPLSLDHVDCLPHNAVVASDGHVLIYDWEQAVWSCPFFSIDILLAFAQNFEETVAKSSRGQAYLVLNTEEETPSAAALREAYLDAYNWGSTEQRAGAFELAMCLSPVRYAFAEGALATKFGHEHYHAEDLAWWLMRALKRWKARVEWESGGAADVRTADLCRSFQSAPTG